MEYKIDMIPQEIATVVPVSQGDVRRPIIIQMTENGKPVAVPYDDASWLFKVICNGEELDADPTPEGKVDISPAVRSLAGSPGEKYCKIFFDINGAKIYSAGFYVEVEKAP